LLKDATLLSINEKPKPNGAPERELVRWWLDPFKGVGIIDVCNEEPGGRVRLVVPGVASTAPQHLSLSFEVIPGAPWSYVVKVLRNCQQVLNATILRPCARLDSAQVQQPTLGQRFVSDELGAIGGAKLRSDSFLAMYIAEMRFWDHVRNESDVCALMTERLYGNETGLSSYFPVLAVDAVARAADPQSKLLTNAATHSMGSSGFGATAKKMSAECTVGFLACPSFDESVGFVLRSSPFNLPPEVTTLETTARALLSVPLVAHDHDNYNDLVLASLGVDTLRFELLQVPFPKCGHIYAKGETLRILESAKRLEYGLPPTTIISSAALPLRFVPFEGATIAEEEAMGGACTTELKYRALDSQGLPSAYIATVYISVWHAGVTLLSVNASDPGGADGKADAGDGAREGRTSLDAAHAGWARS
jgi:hypothetical protein